MEKLKPFFRNFSECHPLQKDLFRPFDLKLSNCETLTTNQLLGSEVSPVSKLFALGYIFYIQTNQQMHNLYIDHQNCWIIVSFDLTNSADILRPIALLYLNYFDSVIVRNFLRRVREKLPFRSNFIVTNIPLTWEADPSTNTSIISSIYDIYIQLVKCIPNSARLDRHLYNINTLKQLISSNPCNKSVDTYAKNVVQTTARNDHCVRVLSDEIKMWLGRRREESDVDIKIIFAYLSRFSLVESLTTFHCFPEATNQLLSYCFALHNKEFFHLSNEECFH